MITFNQVSFAYQPSVESRNHLAKPILQNLTFELQENAWCLVVGPTGSGKSTFLGLINGLVPHFSGGILNGVITVAGIEVTQSRPRDLAGVVGVVPQDPSSSFVSDTVEAEIAYGMEQLGIDPKAMRKRVEEVIDLLGLQNIRSRKVRDLSGGEAQRTAIAAVLVTNPKVLVLDEPTSALDPSGAEEVLATLKRLVDDIGVTVVMAEHRLERVAEFADVVVALSGPGSPALCGNPSEVFASQSIAPPVAQLGKALGWSPLPVTLREGRKKAAAFRANAPHDPGNAANKNLRWPNPATSELAASVTAIDVRYSNVHALRKTTLSLSEGEIAAVMGRNGSGKTTLLSCLVGLLSPESGAVQINGLNPATLAGKERITRIGLVPAQPSDLLICETVWAECVASDKDATLASGTTLKLLNNLAPEISPDTHPRDLSEGQRLCVALAVVCAAGPSVVLLDEPTRGLDYPSKERLTQILTELSNQGTSILVATHDVEFVAQVATRVVVLAEGDVVADGSTREILTASPMFAPQTMKVFQSDEWLTVNEAIEALAVPA